jgi:hypothetical protein
MGCGELTGPDARKFTNAVISFNRNVIAPNSQSKLATTIWALKNANFSVAASHRHDSQ